MINFLKTQVIGRATSGSEIQWIFCEIQCDTSSELPAYDAFKATKNILIYPGSVARVTSPRSSYKLKSDGTWIIQDVGNDYYSKAETDALVSDKLPLKNEEYTPLTTAGTWDLFTLPVGVYYRTSSVSAVSNIPPDLTSAFFCIVQNTIGSNRRQIILFPCVSATADSFYRCLETGSGYGSWYKFSGTVV